jgi:hypothetical protein
LQRHPGADLKALGFPRCGPWHEGCLSTAGDKRATELLAWCHLKGVGVRQDPVPTYAYLLYGVAAKPGVLGAERNQAIVYETGMTCEEQ